VEVLNEPGGQFARIESAQGLATSGKRR